MESQIFTGIDTWQKSVFDNFFSKSVQNIGQSRSLQLAFMIKISLLFISTKHIKVHIRLFKKILSSEVVIGGLHVMYCKWKV